MTNLFVFSLNSNEFLFFLIAKLFQVVKIFVKEEVLLRPFHLEVDIGLNEVLFEVLLLRVGLLLDEIRQHLDDDFHDKGRLEKGLQVDSLDGLPELLHTPEVGQVGGESALLGHVEFLDLLE